jgi:fructokinase
MNGRPVIFGEVLFDCFEDGSRVLGGAPFNVAWHLQAFGLAPLLLSRVGDDAEGAEILQKMRRWGMATDGVGIDPHLPTGSVEVRIRDGEPHYDIVAERAYDQIDEDSLPAVDAALIYHGSLALRAPPSAAALQRIRQRLACPGLMDVNLRPPWWRQEQLQPLLDAARWVKLNQDELRLLAPADDDPRRQARDFLRRHRLDWLILTRGAQGALLFDRHREDVLSIIPQAIVDPVDTVGAGDAFCSVMLLGIMRQWEPATSLQRAQSFASALVQRRGATSEDPSLYQPFLEAWELPD